ncbi:O-antigen ligase [Desulfobaculum xiamenense]|uniref:O-antigen ligase n=1 Tax=Desulfobaculum xiamenense TaxID=995050 RepID=A0A846QPX1_9BACT|nr:O-antigen ligase family protein [Desulfobaculum xiamenense]NJB68373.1 O-antigen ligase [Desulfobaculum xiamenense]
MVRRRVPGVGPNPLQMALPLVMLLGLCLAFGWLLPHLSPTKALAFLSAIIMFMVCLFSTQAALYIIIFSMLLGPEFVVGSTGGASLGRGVTLRVNDFVLVVVAFSWLAKMAMNKRLGLFLHTPLNGPIAAYTLACVVSSGIGAVMGRVDLKTSFFYVVKYFEYMFVYFMVVNHLRSRRQLRGFVLAFIATCVIAAIVGVLQIPGGGRITAPFEGDKGEPNTFGGYLMFMISICGGLAWHLRDYRQRVALVASAGLFLVPLLYTGSRGSYLGLAVAMAVFVLFTPRRVVTGLIMSAIISALLLGAPEIAKRRIEHTFTQGATRTDVEEVMGVRLDTSSSARLRSWMQVSKDWLIHPMLGYGVTGYKFLDGQYFRIIIETGLVGLSLFVFLMLRTAAVLRAVYRRARDDLERGWTMGVLIGFAGLLAHGLSANTFIIGRIMEPFWFSVGMIVMIPRLTDAGDEGEVASVADGDAVVSHGEGEDGASV